MLMILQTRDFADGANLEKRVCLIGLDLIGQIPF